MSKGVNVRIPDRLQSFVAQRTGPHGVYENASEYVRDLIRRDYEKQQETWQWLQNELAPGMSADVSEFALLDAEKIKTNAKKRVLKQRP